MLTLPVPVALAIGKDACSEVAGNVMFHAIQWVWSLWVCFCSWVELWMLLVRGVLHGVAKFDSASGSRQSKTCSKLCLW